MSIATAPPAAPVATAAPAAATGGPAKRLILPVAVIAAVVAGLGLLATVTGVPWSGGSAASAGVQLQSEAGQGATLTISELEPGDSASKTVTIRNSGTTESRLSFEENAAPAAFAGGLLHLRVDQDGRTVYDGVFGGMNDVVQDVGSLAPGGASKFTFTVSLPDSAPFANQGDPAVATYSWVTTASTAG